MADAELTNRLDKLISLQESPYSDVLGVQKARAADGFIEGAQRSGMIERQDRLIEGVSGLERTMASLGGVMNAGFAGITDQLVANGEMLKGVIDSLRNPLDSAADERHRRGVTALEHRWFPEAVTEFSAAVEANPYQPLSQALRGIAQAEEGARSDAIDSFKKSYRYATPGEPEMATGAAIYATSAIEEESGNEPAVTFVKDAMMTYRACPDLTLIHSRLAQTDTFTKDALWLAADLAYPAREGGSVGVEAATAALVDEPGGPVKDAQEIVENLDAYAEASWEDVLEKIPTINWEPSPNDDPFERMTIAGLITRNGSAILAQAKAAEVESQRIDQKDTYELENKIDSRDRSMTAWDQEHERRQKRVSKVQRGAIRYHVYAAALAVVFLVLTSMFGAVGAVVGLGLALFYVWLVYKDELSKLLKAMKELDEHSARPTADSKSKQELKRVKELAETRALHLNRLEALVGKRDHRIIPWSSRVAQPGK